MQGDIRYDGIDIRGGAGMDGGGGNIGQPPNIGTVRELVSSIPPEGIGVIPAAPGIAEGSMTVGAASDSWRGEYGAEVGEPVGTVPAPDRQAKASRALVKMIPRRMKRYIAPLSAISHC
jgi:hypothetical protein